MANLHLVTGYAGTEHITSNDQGSFNAAIMGTGEFVLERGKQFEVQVISNNKVRVFDGDLLMQGRHIRLKENTYVDLFFENGTQGYKRSDLIVVRYEKDPVTDIESASLVVIKGVPTEDAYVSSEKITGDILNEHALQNDTVLYKVNFDGLGIQKPERVFSTVPTLETTKKDTIEQIKQEAEKAIQDMAYAAGELVPLFGSEAPTPETKGKLKQFFVNTENGELFICTEEGETYNWLKVGGEGSNVQVGNVQDLTLEENSDNLTLRWKDPDDVIFNGKTIAEWAGTKVVRKEGGSPESVEDGILITDSKVRNQYAVDGLQDTDVVADVQYNYALFPYTTKNVYTMSDLNKISGALVAHVPVGNVTNLSTGVSLGQISLAWKDPEDVVNDDGVTIATWAGTKLIRNTDHYPENPNDGVLIVDNTTRDKYRYSMYQDLLDIENDVTYYYTLFPYTTEGIYTYSDGNRIEAVGVTLTPWTVVSNGTYGFMLTSTAYGRKEYTSNNKGIDDSTATTTWEVNIEKERNTKICYEVSSENYNDTLTVNLDGVVEVNKIYGKKSGTIDKTLSIGKHTLTATYVKSIANAMNKDIGIITFYE